MCVDMLCREVAMPTAIDVVWPVSAGGALVDDTLPISDDASVFVLSGADMVRLTERDEDPAVELLGPVLISVCSGTLEIVGAVVESVFAMKEPVRMLWEGMLNEGELYDKTTLLVLRLVVEGTEGRAVDSTVGKISVEEAKEDELLLNGQQLEIGSYRCTRVRLTKSPQKLQRFSSSY